MDVPVHFKKYDQFHNNYLHIKMQWICCTFENESCNYIINKNAANCYKLASTPGIGINIGRKIKLCGLQSWIFKWTTFSGKILGTSSIQPQTQTWWAYWYSSNTFSKTFDLCLEQYINREYFRNRTVEGQRLCAGLRLSG